MISTNSYRNLVKERFCRIAGIEDCSFEVAYGHPESIEDGHKIFPPFRVEWIKNSKPFFMFIRPILKISQVGDWPFAYDVLDYDFEAMESYFLEKLNND